MDNRKIEQYVKELTTEKDKRLIYKILMKIRSDVVKTRDGIEAFHAQGGLKPIMELIKRPNEKLVDISLSILGNCCTVEECAKKATDLGAIPPLILLLRTMTSDSIQCRVCRILGNLAGDSSIAKIIQDRGISSILPSVLDDGKPIPTLLMAVRLISKLWKMSNFQRETRELGITKKMMKILIKFSQKDPSGEGSSSSAAPGDDDALARMHPNQEFRESTRKMFNTVVKKMENVRSDIFDYSILGKATKESAADDEFVAPTEVDKCDLFLAIMRCIQMMLKDSRLYMGEHILADGNGYKCLVALGRQNHQFRVSVLSIISTMAYDTLDRDVIGRANAVTMASELLQRDYSEDAEKCLSALEMRNCVTIICLLASDSCNRAKIRHSGALKTLLQRFRVTECRQERDMIMYGLTFFCYDQMSIQLLVKEGLIGALIKRLAEELAEATVDHVKIDRETTDLKVTKRKRFQQLEIDLLMKRLRSRSPKPWNFSEPGSPSSCSGYGSLYTNQGSPSSYGSISPKSSSPRSTDLESDDESATYSPVCSDDDDDATHPPKMPKIEKASAEPLAPELDPIIDEDSTQIADILAVEETSQEAALIDAVAAKNEVVETCTIKRILLLLRDMPLRLAHAPELARVESLQALLKASRFISNPHGYCDKILCFVAQDTKNFVPLLQNDFVIDIYKLRRTDYDHKNCQSCQEMKTMSSSVLGTLSAIAESGYGRGELAHYLLTGEPGMRKHVAIIATFIIRAPKFLYTFLVDHSALYTVMEIILTDERSLAEKACLGITALAGNLNIADNPGREETENMEYDEDGYTLVCLGHSMISFVVKDNQRVAFSEKILKECSDVFNSMLTSQFKESINKEIHISDISVAGIKYFLNLIVLNRAESLDTVPLTSDMTPALEAYELSMRYMLTDLEGALVTVIRKIINESSALRVFQWAMNNNNHHLLEISIYYYLTSDICGQTKSTMFREADMSEYGNQWNQLILDTIVDKCVASMDLTS
ncbi:hypothetical protein DMENIID0001_016850 [Sergentomyia squamirostris]